MKKAFLGSLVFLCLDISVASELKEDFTVKRVASRSQKFQHLREQLAEKLGDQLRGLIETLSLLSERLLVSDLLPIAEKELEVGKIFAGRLCEMKSFLRGSGELSCSLVFKNVKESDRKACYSIIIGAIADVQYELVAVLQNLLENNKSCPFVACKVKAQLEKKIESVAGFTSIILQQNNYIRTIVQNSKKPSD